MNEFISTLAAFAVLGCAVWALMKARQVVGDWLYDQGLATRAGIAIAAAAF
jgi:hypothetical protein